MEFAIIAVLLFLILFGIIEFSLALYDKAVITNASREGARTAILFTPPNPATQCYDNAKSQADVQAVVEGYVTNRLITFSDGPPAVTVNANPGTYADNDGNGCLSRGDYRTVTVTFAYDYLVLPGFITSLAGATSLDAATTMRME